MDDPTTDHLRNRPRQARSAARVEHLLDVAAEVFEEVGYDAATTNLVAARAGPAMGTRGGFGDTRALQPFFGPLGQAVVG